MRRYDSRPAAAALAARMRRDRVTGTVRPIVTEHMGSGYGCNPPKPYQLVQSGVFDEDGALIAYYSTNSRGKIMGNKPRPGWGWYPPKYTLLSDAEDA